MATIDDVYNLLVTVDGKIDTLQTDVTAIKGYIDLEVAAIKTQTDKLNFTGTEVHAKISSTSTGAEVVLGPDRFADFAESTY